MKLEIVKDQKYGEPTWYFVKVDDITFQCSKDLKEMEQLYEHIKNNPEVIKNQKTILRSEEI